MKFKFNNLEAEFNVKDVEDLYAFYDCENGYYIANLPVVYLPYSEQVKFLISFLKIVTLKTVKEDEEYVKQEVRSLRNDTYRYVLFINPKTKENYCCVWGETVNRKGLKAFKEIIEKEDIVPLIITDEEVEYIKSFI